MHYKDFDLLRLAVADVRVWQTASDAAAPADAQHSVHVYACKARAHHPEVHLVLSEY